MTREQRSSRRPDNGRGLFYSRDSGGEHEQTPASYVEWAAAEAARMGLQFSGTGEAINKQLAERVPARGDLFFDYIVSGNLLSRPALDALKAEIRRDKNISHVFIPRRDRLARPDNAADGMALEKALGEEGITLVFRNKVVPPLKRGQRLDMAEALAAYIDYDTSGRFRDDLAEKMLLAQIQLARQGFSTGGRAPFGFRRHLVSSGGVIVRELLDGEIVRQRGHHVVWLPGPESERELIRRILEMLETIPACRVAKILNREGIPSPDSGRKRRDGGIEHAVSGLWHTTTITNIARNPLLQATMCYGRRSMGDRRRMSPDGPRPMEDTDYGHDEKPKVISNPFSNHIVAPARFEPLIPRDQIDRLQEALDRRGGTQRGKPRSRDPERNPLGTRVFDMACGWPLYRVAAGVSFSYRCGLYMQSHGDNCRHNSIDGPTATQFALAAIRQTFLRPQLREQLERRLREKLAAQLAPSGEQTGQLLAKRGELETVRQLLAKAKTNMVLADGADMLQIFQTEIRRLQAEVARLEAEIQELEQSQATRQAPQDQLTAAMGCLDQLQDLAADPQNFGAIGRLFQQVNLQMFLRFKPEKKKKRIVNKLAGAILTTGSAAAPIKKYDGRTQREAVRLHAALQETASTAEPAGCGCSDHSDRMAKSLGNRNRDDRTPLELFLAGLWGWDAKLRCRVAEGKPGSDCICVLEP